MFALSNTFCCTPKLAGRPWLVRAWSRASVSQNWMAECRRCLHNATFAIVCWPFNFTGWVSQQPSVTYNTARHACYGSRLLIIVANLGKYVEHNNVNEFLPEKFHVNYYDFVVFLFVIRQIVKAHSHQARPRLRPSTPIWNTC